jgi:PAS domain S-box-containing protein
MDERLIRVLHVEDDPEFADLTATVLEREGVRFAVDTAANADEALERIREHPPDCVVSEYDMPGMNGIEFLRAVRARYPDLPFVLFTGKGSEAVASDAISAGVTDYLQKDLGTEQYELLVNRVEQSVDRYRTTQELERQNDLFSKTQDIATIGAWEHDLTSDDLHWTDRLYEMHGLSSEFEPALESVLELYHPDDRPKLREAVDRATTAGEPYDLEVRMVARDDGDRWVRTVADPQVVDGTVVRVRGTVHDITERKQRERELQRQRDRYRSLFENNPLIIWEEDFSTAVEYIETIASDVDDVESHLLENPQEINRIMERVETIDVNRNAVDYYDAPSKDVLLENAGRVFAEGAVEALAAAWAAIAAGERRFRTETVSRTFSGEKRNELLDVFVPEKYAEDCSRVYVTSTDITEAKEHERRLELQNERLDQFASVVSHDLRNPLNVAEGRLELAREECDSPHLRDVADAHERMEGLIGDLLRFARMGSEAIDRRTVPLRQLLEECWEPLGGDDAALVVETGRTVRADRDRLRQLLENLLTNAVEHGGAAVTITVGDLDDGFYIEDDGPGIPADERTEVFDAGYSSSGEGTGFGLSIVKQVAEAHGWDVSPTDSDDGGARFEITGVEFVE